MSSPAIIQSPLPIRVFNPSNVAILASVSVHALLLLVALPSLSKLSTQLPDNKRSVGVIQLNEAEQARLPDFSPPAPTTPTTPNTSTTPLIDTPISETPQGGIYFPPLSALPPLPSTPSSYPALPSYPSSYPPLPPNTPLPIGIAPNSYPLANIPRPQPLPNLPLNPQNDQTIDRSNLPFAPPSRTLTSEDIRRASQNASEQRQREIYGQLPQQTANLPQGNPSNVSQPPTVLNEQNRRDLIARRLVVDNLRRQELLRYNPQNTTDDEANNNDLAYQKQTGTILTKDKIVYIAATYPKDACLRRLEGTSVYGVSGNQSPVRIKSSGIPLFDQYAQQIAQSKGFAAPTRVAVTFKFDPKVCPGLSIPTDREPVKPSLPENPATEVRLAPPTPQPNPETTQPKPTETRVSPPSLPSPPPQQEAATSKPPLPLKTPERVIPSPVSPPPPEAAISPPKSETPAAPTQAVPDVILPAPAAPKKPETSPLGEIAPRKTSDNE